MKPLMLYKWSICPYWEHVLITEDPEFPEETFYRYIDDVNTGNGYVMCTKKTAETYEWSRNYTYIDHDKALFFIPNIKSMIETIKEIQDSKETVGL